MWSEIRGGSLSEIIQWIHSGGNIRIPVALVMGRILPKPLVNSDILLHYHGTGVEKNSTMTCNFSLDSAWVGDIVMYLDPFFNQ